MSAFVTFLNIVPMVIFVMMQSLYCEMSTEMSSSVEQAAVAKRQSVKKAARTALKRFVIVVRSVVFMDKWRPMSEKRTPNRLQNYA